MIKNRGFQEILNSPIYKDYVISKDGKTSGIVIYLKKDERLNEYIKLKEKYFFENKKKNKVQYRKKNIKNF